MNEQVETNLGKTIRVTDLSQIPEGAKRIGKPYTSRYKSTFSKTMPTMVRSDKFPLDGVSVSILHSGFMDRANEVTEHLTDYAMTPPSEEVKRFLDEMKKRKIDVMSLFRG